MDVIVPVFDPGLSEDDEEGVWPQVRRAEANRFAVKMKQALENTGAFGAVRVTPDRTASGEVYVLGTIKQSNGEVLAITLEVKDISGERWMNETFNLTVKQGFHDLPSNQNKDPYDPLFDEAARKIADELKNHADKELKDLRYLTDLRFGASFSEDSFKRYMDVSGGRVKLVGKPSDDDPMLGRIRALRVRDQLFVDGLQDDYDSFAADMDDSYYSWQDRSLDEIIAEREARKKAIRQGIGGILSVGLAVTAAILGARSDTIGGQAAGTTGAIVGGMAGASLIKKSFQTSEEATIHREALNELGQSLDIELDPKVVELDKKTVELTGTAREQFAQWRAFLREIYAAEATPDVQL